MGQVAYPSDRAQQQLADVATVLIEFGGNANAVDHDPARVLREMLLAQHPDPAASARPSRDVAAPYYGPGDRVDVGRLRAGSTIRRYAEPVRGGKLDIPMPCCARTLRVTPDMTEIGIVACPTSCQLTYDAVLVDEGDDSGEGESSFAAVFTVRHEPITLARLYPRRR
jgi:hypothetical protein